MPFIKTIFPGLMIFEPVIYKDSRGYFFESYNKKTFSGDEIDIPFVQDNQASSVFGVIRGLHYQLDPYAQTKLVRALSGSILDVVVDIRQGSPTFGKTYSIELSAENKKQLLVPQGFAHGYSVLSQTAEVFYKDYDNVPVSVRNGISLSNLGADFNVLGNEAVTTNGQGRAYGFELFAQQKLTKRFFGILSYTFYRSEYNGRNRDFIPSSWDNRQLLTVTMGYKLPRNWEIGLKFRFQGGAPYTPFDEAAYKADLGVKALWGEKNYSTNERTGIRPTLELNGIWGGYTGEGSKTVLPSKAFAKISCRLVPNQRSDKMEKLVIDHLYKIAPPYVQIKVTPHHGGDPYMTPVNSIEYKAAAKAIATTFGKEPIPVRGGGSIPITALFEKELGCKVVFLGFGLDSDNLHSPNEKYELYNFYKGIETIPYFHKYYAEMKK